MTVNIKFHSTCCLLVADWGLAYLLEELCSLNFGVTYLNEYSGPCTRLVGQYDCSLDLIAYSGARNLD